MEAGQLCPAKMIRFKHNDMDDLESKLTLDKSKLVVTEGVFSMDGDLSPLNELSQLCQKSDSWLAVDDAHGVGVLGNEGRGACHAASVQPDILIVTFGKAFGFSGAAILCNAQVGDFLSQFSKHHVYSTAMPPSQAYALTHAIGMIRTQQWRRDKLIELSGIFKEQLHEIPGFQDTATAIKPFIFSTDWFAERDIAARVDDTEWAVGLSNALKQQGFWVTPIRPPTVPKGTARIRITLTANHSNKQIMTLATAIKQEYFK
jgi:8-amino-7-oxononanoate synthase